MTDESVLMQRIMSFINPLYFLSECDGWWLESIRDG
jgi:hypothetical protein